MHVFMLVFVRFPISMIIINTALLVVYLDDNVQ